jgi:hypothetical protein
MPNRTDSSSEWLSNPPAPGEARIAIAIGENAKLSPKVREALEEFARSLSEHAAPSEGGLQPHRAGLQTQLMCNRVYVGPCRAFVECHGVQGM